MRRIPIGLPQGSIPWRFWASIALVPFVPLVAIVTLSVLCLVPGLGALLEFQTPLLWPVALAASIAMSLWAVVRSMREARRSANRWALLLPLPSLVMAALAVQVLRDMLLWMSSR
jgi:hypothetical protein